MKCNSNSEMTIQPDGTKEWFRNGKRHRDDGPAIEWFDGTKVWFREGQLHRDDGPAYEAPDGVKEWHLFGRQVTQPEFDVWRRQRQKQEQEQRDSARAALTKAIEQGLALQKDMPVKKPLRYKPRPKSSKGQ